MQSVTQILKSKDHSVVSVTPDTPVYDALVLMESKNIGAILVIDGNDLVGIFSERDYARKSVKAGEACQHIAVADMMSTDVLFIKPENTIQECMALMTDKRVRHLPVLEGNKTIGMISIGDVVKSTISEQEFVIQQLENYISGR